MNKYIVTYRTLALVNSEIEVSEPDADEMRAKIATKKDYEPLVTGRDWQWTDCVKTVVIEADSYSVAANGAAHFYRIPYGTAYYNNTQAHGDLVYSVTNPVTIGIEGDAGVTELEVK